MSRCPKLDYESRGYITNSMDKYICKVTGQKMDVDDPKVEYACDSKNTDAYKNCPVYQKS